MHTTLFLQIHDTLTNRDKSQAEKPISPVASLISVSLTRLVMFRKLFARSQLTSPRAVTPSHTRDRLWPDCSARTGRQLL